MSEAVGSGQGRLLKVVEVHPDDKVICRAVGCGRGVYKRIHVVEACGQITVLGSDCFERLYGSGGREDALYGGSSADGEVRMLSAAERSLLEANTEAFIELMRHEHEEAVEAEMQAMEVQLAAQRQRAAAEAQRWAEHQQRMEAFASARREAMEEEERRRAEKEALERAIEEFDQVKRGAIESMVRDDLWKAYQINVSLPGWAGWYRSSVRRKIIEALGKAPAQATSAAHMWGSPSGAERSSENGAVPESEGNSGDVHGESGALEGDLTSVDVQDQQEPPRDQASLW